MKLLPLSTFKHWPPLCDLMDALFDGNYDGVINDLAPKPHVEYSLHDLTVVDWKNFQKLWVK